MEDRSTGSIQMQAGDYAKLLYSAVDALPKMRHAAFAVLLVLFRRANRITGVCWPSKPTIAKAAGLRIRAVEIALARLTGLRWIEPAQGPNGERGWRVFCLPGAHVHAQTVGTAAHLDARKCARGCAKSAHVVAPRTIRRREQEEEQEHTRVCVSGSHDFFLEFWRVWPRKESRDEAADAYHTALLRVASEDSGDQAAAAHKINAAAAAFATSGACLDVAPRHIPFASTWLKKRRYLDDPAAWQRNGDSQNGSSDNRGSARKLQPADDEDGAAIDARRFRTPRVADA